MRIKNNKDQENLLGELPVTSVSFSTIDEIQIDDCLNPNSSTEKGYKWVKDTILSFKAPILAEEIINLANKGYRISLPSCTGSSKIFVGIYRPMNN